MAGTLRALAALVSAANPVNNIPMSVLYRSVISALPAGTGNGTAALYAAVVGSNLGAFFTPMGALAGIMWTGQLRDHGVPFSFWFVCPLRRRRGDPGADGSPAGALDCAVSSRRASGALFPVGACFFMPPLDNCPAL